MCTRILITCLIITTSVWSHIVSTQELSRIHIDNSVLTACVDIKGNGYKRSQNNILLKVDIHIRRLIGYCGCKSMLMSYHSYAGKKYLNGGTFWVRGSEEKTVTVPVSSIVQYDRSREKVLVRFGCAL